MSCVSNSKEPVTPMFIVEGEEPLRMRCHYCNRVMRKEDVLSQF